MLDFQFPDPGDPMMGYAYLFMAVMFMMASFSVYRFKKASRKRQVEEKHEVYEMFETQEEHEQKQDETPKK
jgi:hypothetical protein